MLQILAIFIKFARGDAMDDETIKQRFGSYLARLREWRKRRTDKGLKKWTQTELSQITGIGKYTLSRIEKGKGGDVKQYLQTLADALELNETQRRIFYAKAGLVYHTPPLLPELPPIQRRQKLSEMALLKSFRTEIA